MSDTNQVDASPSVLNLLNQSNRRLERLLQTLHTERNAEAELRDIARDVIHAVELDPDIALATIFLSQIAGTYAVRHCIETAVVTVVIARRMGKSAAEIQTVTAAALTMNVGMLRHNESFQNKSSPLSNEELAIVRSHPEESADLLKYAGVQDQEWISCVLLHHENDDGSGYPAGVASPEVTLNAKLLSLADRYCAQVSARNYRKSVLPDRAMRNLAEDKAAPCDPQLLEHFQRELGDFPPGCLVRLADGGIGVVSRRQGCSNGLQVHSLRDPSGAMLTPAQPRCLSDGEWRIAEALSEDQASTRFSMKQIWGARASL
ncbi:HD-GYP domain-containing protein [Duganella aceris]|uniref:HD domain-containing protein n=1 Tax=Duganella aceris TaxID=2703883 RepID=A0ABX0FJ67_9BURK|nr:HD domain-containing phosphohydrolase [Duganella aceris]NGZ84609.1 HD domain-containing protein [Duganella aceris]